MENPARNRTFKSRSAGNTSASFIKTHMRKCGCITAIQGVGEINKIPFLASFMILGGSKIKDSPAISGPVKAPFREQRPGNDKSTGNQKGLMD